MPADPLGLRRGCLAAVLQSCTLTGSTLAAQIFLYCAAREMLSRAFMARAFSSCFGPCRPVWCMLEPLRSAKVKKGQICRRPRAGPEVTPHDGAGGGGQDYWAMTAENRHVSRQAPQWMHSA